MGLRHLHHIDTGVNLADFGQLSQLVANASGRPVPWHKSLVGQGAFTHEAGIHVDGLLKDLRNYQGIDPKELGLEHCVVVGKHSGTHAIREVYARMQIPLSREQSEALLAQVRLFVKSHKRSPLEADLLQLHGALYGTFQRVAA